MARINVHLDDVESTGFTVFPDGSYRVEVQPSSKLVEFKSGSAGIRWIARCTEGEMEGKLVSWNSSLLPEALWNLKSMLEALGFEWDEDGFELEDTFEKELIVDVSSYHYEKDPPEVLRNQVDGFHPVSSGKKK